MMFEYELKLNGRDLYAVGEIEYESQCDCFGSGTHVHLIDADIDSVYDQDSNLEVILTDELRYQLLPLIENVFYGEQSGPQDYDLNDMIESVEYVS